MSLGASGAAIAAAMIIVGVAAVIYAGLATSRRVAPPGMCTAFAFTATVVRTSPEPQNSAWRRGQN
jgi:hypothetical protein